MRFVALLLAAALWPVVAFSHGDEKHDDQQLEPIPTQAPSSDSSEHMHSDGTKHDHGNATQSKKSKAKKKTPKKVKKETR